MTGQEALIIVPLVRYSIRHPVNNLLLHSKSNKTSCLNWLDKMRSLLFEKHLAPYFVTAVPEVIEFMKSDMALRVFEPEVWKEIERFPPLELKFKDTFLKATFMFRQPTLIRKRSLGVPTHVSVHVRSERASPS